MGPSSQTLAAAENIDFSPPKHDERKGAVLEGPAHRLRNAAISLREANSSRAVRSPMSPHPPFLCPHAHALWQVSRLVLPQPQRAGADSTVKMITNGQELRHPAAEGPPPPDWRLHLGGAGRRRRRRLHLCAGRRALVRACASLDLRAPRPPAAACLRTCLAGHLKEVLCCSWLVSD